MSNNQRPQNSNNNRNNPITTEEQLAQFFEIQKQKLANEAKDLILKEKDMDYQSKYAHELLKGQIELEKDRPNQNRKNITRLAYLICGFVVILMLFSAYCLSLGKEDFLYALFKGAGYLVTTLAGYYFGRKSKSGDDRKNENSVEEITD